MVLPTVLESYPGSGRTFDKALLNAVGRLSRDLSLTPSDASRTIRIVLMAIMERLDEDLKQITEKRDWISNQLALLDDYVDRSTHDKSDL